MRLYDHWKEQVLGGEEAKGPPERMCSRCEAAFRGLRNLDQPCKIRGCTGTWVYAKWAQLEALVWVGAYGLLRFGVGFLPDAWTAWAPWIAALGAISAIYGALNAIAQLDMRRLVAYSSLGHMGFLLLADRKSTRLNSSHRT